MTMAEPIMTEPIQLIASYRLLLSDLLARNLRKGKAVGDLVGYVFDLLEPLGYTLAEDLYRSGKAPNPEDVLRSATRAKGSALRPVGVGMMLASEWTRLEGFRLLKAFPPPPPHHVRIVAVAGGVEVVDLAIEVLGIAVARECASN